jgi:DNA-directed RNA polymerase specialized sigma24 family protein
VGLTINDNNLLLSLHKGDHEAFNVIFHYFTQPLHFFLKGIVHDDMAAEDIAIEAFTKTFRRNTDFTSIAKLKSFLFTTASMLIISHSHPIVMVQSFSCNSI